VLYKVDLKTRKYYFIEVPSEINTQTGIDEYLKTTIATNIQSLADNFDKNFTIESTGVNGTILNRGENNVT